MSNRDFTNKPVKALVASIISDTVPTGEQYADSLLRCVLGCVNALGGDIIAAMPEQGNDDMIISWLNSAVDEAEKNKGQHHMYAIVRADIMTHDEFVAQLKSLMTDAGRQKLEN